MNIEILQKPINDQPNSINLRDIYFALEISQDFSTWAKYQINNINYRENEDYIKVLPSKGEKKIEYYITLELAKHITMSSKSTKGYELRQYFIQLEKNYNIIQKEILQNIQKEYMVEERKKASIGFRNMLEAASEHHNRNHESMPILDTKNQFTSKETNNIYRVMYNLIGENYEYDAVRWIQDKYNTNLKPRDYFQNNNMKFELWVIKALEDLNTGLLNLNEPLENRMMLLQSRMKALELKKVKYEDNIVSLTNV